MDDWRDGMIAVDWGTTNRRAYLLDGGGAVLADMEDDRGITDIDEAGFADAATQITSRLGDHPLLLAGMVGSDRGWMEAPYVDCPASLRELAQHLIWIAPGRVAIVPGLAQRTGDRADVMRGEEVQVFGHLAITGSSDALICHPGTHTKWIAVAGGAIVGFRTFMTGELFALLHDHSILAPLLQGEVEPDEAFLDGARQGLGEADLAAELFGVRARVLLSRQDAASAGSWVSGLLIGADIRGGLASFGGTATDPVTVLGRPSLNRLYAAAMALAGRNAVEADGATAFVAGMHRIRETMA